jgi:hypothetical protein
MGHRASLPWYQFVGARGRGASTRPTMVEFPDEALADSERNDNPETVVSPRRSRNKQFGWVLRILGSGLVTGAADDDPSAIATYSQAGAQLA